MGAGLYKLSEPLGRKAIFRLGSELVQLKLK
ncbi:Hypothetical protein DEACI_0490 [Acididesulfobacillus acetoxydans]|uniref:Uncharacterized protein n=1 Tax=Acididesulfobacillus acetoxydans TaxID=1561005 RepID=A0A8S0XAI1_9FIRM|nr:Hypothetical protein DEACI_0490 [Acididesulfobacillus acetoxydans]CEJ07422.1 Hypothetical protein DEACI_1887 [Acididesulfobacillus acetoxydans]